VREVRDFVQRHRGAPGACAAYGTFGHPSPAGAYHATSATQASHRVVALRWAGEELHGVLEVLPTPAGEELLRSLIRGDAIGVSTRGWARLRLAATAAACGAGAAADAQDFQLIAFDAVCAPATHGAALLASAPQPVLLEATSDSNGLFDV
jgi:hypothetical protein